MVNHTTETVEIVVNGESRSVPAGMTVLALLKHVGVAPERVAVEMNRRIVRQAEWESTSVGPGARFEIVQFVGGG
jgi:thiamine biosynthesis protein ThiS